MKINFYSSFLLSFALIASLMMGCATRPNVDDKIAYATYEETNDPLEPMNRYFFELTRFADFLFLAPISEIYKTVVPKYPRQMLNNFYSNLGEPLNFINNVFQGSFGRAGITLGRFTINSSIGIVGLFDPADYFFNLQEKPEDFGQTLAIYGMPEGPFLFLPFAGPSSFRDAIGSGLTVIGDPIRYIGSISAVENFQNNTDILIQMRIPINALEISSSQRRFIIEVERQSVDFYAAVREFYRQSRRNAILNGELDIDALPEIPDDDFFDE